MLPIPNPIAFSVLGIDVRWYGILVAAAILTATVTAYARAPKYGIKSDKILDFALICVPFGVVGARLYYVAFNWSFYAGDVKEIVNIRGGGLAIHGGLILGIAVALLLCALWRIRPLNILDLVMPSVALAQAIGRWGNYFNSEAHGGPTSLPWGILVNGETVHPTFLYESVWCLIIFLVLIMVDRSKRFEGQICLLYGMMYSFERFFVEFLRTDSLMLFGIVKQAMVLSAVIFVLCLAAYIVMGKRALKKNTIFFGGPTKYKGKFKR